MAVRINFSLEAARSIYCPAMTEEGKGSTYDIDTVDVVNVVEFSPFELSSNLLAYGTSTRITIGTCKFQVRTSST